jgi:hypothetical protein
MHTEHSLERGIFDQKSKHELLSFTMPFPNDTKMLVNKNSNYLLEKLQQRKRVQSHLSTTSTDKHA